MKKIIRAIKAVSLIIKNPYLLNHILNSDTVWQNYLNNNHPTFNKGQQIDLLDLCPNFNEKITEISMLEGSSLITDFALLKTLAKRFANTSFFEIGTYRGETTVNIASVAEKCLTLNLSKQEIMNLGLSEKYADLHEFFSHGKENIKHIKGNSKEINFDKFNQKFDLIFIDGGHDYETVLSDTKNVFNHLIHEKSIVVWHDFAYNPEKLRPEVISAVLDGTPIEFRKFIHHVSNTMCGIFIREEIKANVLDYPSIPNKYFDIHIKAMPIEP